MNEIRLTDRELHALAHLALGIPATHVARRLAMSESTLRRAVRGASAKLGANGTTNAIYIAAKRGLI